jgi:hypothetical protein
MALERSGIGAQITVGTSLAAMRGAVSVSVICDFDPTFTPHLATNGAIAFTVTS